MHKFQYTIILFALALFSYGQSEIGRQSDASLQLWYDKPASNWTEALPLGNGRLGAMVYGGIEKEVVQFNEETLWTGQPHDYANTGAHNYLEEMRQLLWSEKQDEAHRLGNRHFMSRPLGQFSYQAFGTITLDFPEHGKATNYKRQLDLNNAFSSVDYEVGGVKYKREVLVSSPDQALVIHLEADKEGEINFIAGLNTLHSYYEISVSGDEVILRGKANNYPNARGSDENPYPKSALTFEARLKVVHKGGELLKEGKSIQIKNADSATLYLVAATNFVSYNDISADPTERCDTYLKEMAGESYGQIRARHIEDYRELFARVALDLGSSEISDRPTDDRIATFEQDEDPALIALLYQFGRYLLISSSRPGTQPANLQGIWNHELAPAWDSKYTININTEMNYWPAEITNLSELSDPLIEMVEDLAVTGQKVAKEHYEVNGWVTHHNTDIWRGAAPINDANHGIWVTGGAWLCQHLWWHYQFTGDTDYLKDKAYPILKEASRFFTEYLVPHPEHPEWLVSGPSNSPESGGLVMGPTMDHQIIRNLFTNTIEAAQILGLDEDFVKLLQEKRAKLPPNQIGRHGQLQEWLEDRDDPENKHRHLSHLWALHPGNSIHPTTTPDLAEACKVTLSHRGDGGSGWSRAWKINFYARLLDGDHSFLLLKKLITPSTIYDRYVPDNGGLYANLFDACPPFQIDGNFGATSGITEMLLQSHLRHENGTYYQDLLPALPSELSEGKITGIKGRGGFEISISWKKGALVSVKAKSLLGNHLLLRYNGKSVSRATIKGESLSFVADDFE